jgi:hypothetical protein
MDIIFGLITLFLTIVALLFFIYSQNELHQVERKDLLDRIMSRSFAEYKDRQEQSDLDRELRSQSESEACGITED